VHVSWIVPSPVSSKQLVTVVVVVDEIIVVVGTVPGHVPSAGS
jgi:hypothetical protein